MKGLRMSEVRRATLLRALQDAEDWQAGLSDAHRCDPWIKDPPDFKEMRHKCAQLIAAYREIYKELAELKGK